MMAAGADGLPHSRAPLVIGAIGGSGTRAVARVAQRLGVYMGARRNASEDALAFVPFYDHWIAGPVEARESPAANGEMVEEFHACVRRHCMEMPANTGPWGWKNPRSIYLLPFFHAALPGMRFLHVIRDGRDAALGANQNQLTMYGRLWLSDQEARLEAPLQSLLLWSTVNAFAADYGEQRLGDAYLRIRLEDLCAAPRQSVERIRDFLGLGAADVAAAAAEVVPPGSIGRWRGAPLLQPAVLPAAAREALRRFGYLDGSA